MRYFLKLAAWRLSLIILYSLMVLPEQKNLVAQPILERISATDRADGMGFVIRFHLSEAGTRHLSVQTAADTIQIILNHPELKLTDPLPLPDHPEIFDIQYTTLEGEARFEIHLSGNQNYQSASYLDQNTRDILLAFQHTPIDTTQQTYHTPIFTPPPPQPLSEVSEQATTQNSKLKTQSPPAQPSRPLGEPQPKPQPQLPKLSTLNSQLLPNDPLTLYLRWISKKHQPSSDATLNYSGGSIRVPEHYATDHPWSSHDFFQTPVNERNEWRIFDPVLFISTNSDYPMGNGYDGALWQGRGLNTSFTMGGAYVRENLEVVLRPMVVYSENSEFDLSPHPSYEGLSEYAMSRSYSDLPQRFGSGSFSRLDPGESYIRGIYQGWTAGLSTQRITTGPARFNPLMFGPNAPGFLHSFVGTDEPFDILFGQIETRWFWGSLQDSDYFYGDTPEDQQRNSRYITGLTFHYSPDILPGLKIGFTRTTVRYFPENGLSFKDLFMVAAPRFEKNAVTDPEDARFIKSSLFLRWHFPESGFEVYTEWGRNDNKRSFRDFISEPELNNGYVLGFLKQFEVGAQRRVLLFGEITNLENSTMTAQARDYNIWYTNPVIQQGFTHRGKALGASIGPGSNTQQLGASYYDRFGMIGFRLGRIAYHNDRLVQNLDYYRSTLQRPWIPTRRMLEVEMFGSLHAVVFLPGGLELQTDIRYGNIESRNNRFEIISAAVTEMIFIDESNWNMSLTLRYRLNAHSR